MKVDNLKFLESRMHKISRTEGVPADSCRSCMHDRKLLARNTKIHEQIYLLMVKKGLMTVGDPGGAMAPPCPR